MPKKEDQKLLVKLSVRAKKLNGRKFTRIKTEVIITRGQLLTLEDLFARTLLSEAQRYTDASE